MSRERMPRGRNRRRRALMLTIPLSSERLIALVRLRADAAVVGAQLVAHARRVLPLDKVPRAYAGVPEWALPRSGKPDFEALRQVWAAGSCTRLP